MKKNIDMAQNSTQTTVITFSELKAEKKKLVTENLGKILGKIGINSITSFHIKWIYHLMPFLMLFTNIIIASTANPDWSTFWPLKNDLNLGYIFSHQGGGGKA